MFYTYLFFAYYIFFSFPSFVKDSEKKKCDVAANHCCCYHFTFQNHTSKRFFWRVRNRRVTEPHLVIKCSIFYLKTLCCWVSFNITKSMFTSYTIRNLKLVAITTGHQLSLSLSFLYSRKCVLLSTANQLECQLQSQIISLLFIE